jgi:hypothetical protein
MYNSIFIGVFVLSILSVESRSERGEDIGGIRGKRYARRSYHHEPSHQENSCDTETQVAMAEVKSEIQDLRQLVIGLRQKLDPDFKLLPSPVPKCPPGFEYAKLARSCYKVIYEGLDWTSADQRCHGLHPEAHLVAITTHDKNIGLKAYLKDDLAKNSHRNVCEQDKMLWTSGQRQNETNCDTPFVWKISNDKHLPLSFAYWDPTEPNCQANEEQCLHLRPGRNFKWNDISCDKKFCPVCEFDPL